MYYIFAIKKDLLRENYILNLEKNKESPLDLQIK